MELNRFVLEGSKSSESKYRRGIAKLLSLPSSQLATLERNLQWFKATADFIKPPKYEQSILYDNAVYSEEEFHVRPTHIFGDSFAKGVQDPDITEDGEEINYPPHPAAGVMADELERKQGVNWQVVNHAEGGSTTDATINQILTFRNSDENEEETICPDYHIQVGGIDFIALLDRPEVLETVIQASKSNHFLNKSTLALPLILRDELVAFKTRYRTMLESLFMGRKPIPRRVFLYGQPDGSQVPLAKAKMLAISEINRDSVLSLSEGDEKKLRLVSGHTSELIENASHRTAFEFIRQHYEQLQDLGVEIHFIRYRERLRKEHIKREHPTLEGSAQVAGAIMDRCFYKGKSFTELVA